MGLTLLYYGFIPGSKSLHFAPIPLGVVHTCITEYKHYAANSECGAYCLTYYVRNDNVDTQVSNAGNYMITANNLSGVDFSAYVGGTPRAWVAAIYQIFGNLPDSITARKLTPSINNVVLYNEVTGEVKHIHDEVFYEDVMKLDKDEIERKAFTFAEKKISGETNLIKALHLLDYDFKMGAKYIVNVNTLTLTEKKEETN